MFDPSQLPFTCSAAFFMSIQPILVAFSKNEAGGFDYSIPASTMFSEVLKLAISAALLLRQCARDPVKIFHDEYVSEFFAYMTPALIYFINNNCLFFILRAVDPTTFQLLSQMKTIFTGLLFRLLLKRRLSTIQYLALITLACGTACSQLPDATAPAAERDHRRHQALTSAWGVALSVVSSGMSALGGVYSEKLLKGRPSASIHWQNIQLYVWGVAFNALGVYMKDMDTLLARGLFAGFDKRACAVVLCNALNGLAISAVLKYADNIARVYAHAIAMMITMLACVHLFKAPVTPQLVLAVILVATSTFQYNIAKAQPEAVVSELESNDEDCVEAKLIKAVPDHTSLGSPDEVPLTSCRTSG